MRLDDAALYFDCTSRSMTLCTEGAFHISIYCYDATWTEHLEFETGIVQHRIEVSNAVRPSSA